MIMQYVLNDEEYKEYLELKDLKIKYDNQKQRILESFESIPNEIKGRDDQILKVFNTSHLSLNVQQILKYFEIEYWGSFSINFHMTKF